MKITENVKLTKARKKKIDLFIYYFMFLFLLNLVIQNN